MRLSLRVYVCVSVSVNKISQKILNRSTLLLVEAFPLTKEGNHLILKQLPWGKGVCVGGGGSKFEPNMIRDMWLLLDIDRKSYMGSPNASLHLTLSDLEKSNSRLLYF